MLHIGAAASEVKKVVKQVNIIPYCKITEPSEDLVYTGDGPNKKEKKGKKLPI